MLALLSTLAPTTISALFDIKVGELTLSLLLVILSQLAERWIGLEGLRLRIHYDGLRAA